MEPLQRVTPPTLDVLATLLESTRPLFGLEIMKATGRPSGTIYPILDRLERQGWLTSEWADNTTTQLYRRRLYTFTPDGADAARTLLAARA